MEFRFTTVTVAVAIAAIAGCAQADGDGAVRTSAEAAPEAAIRTIPPKGEPLRNQIVGSIGGKVFAFGGDELENGRRVRAVRQAAIYSVESGTWKEIEFPFSAPLIRAGAVFAGDRVFVVGTPCDKEYPVEDVEPQCPDAKPKLAAYAADSGDWVDIAGIGDLFARNQFGRPPIFRGIGWTGSHALFRVTDGLAFRYLLYDTGANEWSELSPRGSVCIAGGGIYSINLPEEVETGVSRPATLSTLRYDVDSEVWTSLGDHPFPDVGQTMTDVFCENDEMVVVPSGVPGRLTVDGMLWFNSATSRWESVPEIPEFFARAIPATVDGSRLLWPQFPSDQYWLLEPGASRWSGTRKPISGEALLQSDSADRVLVRRADSGDTGVLLDPERYAAESAAGELGQR